jgi:hypothetical protein
MNNEIVAGTRNMISIFIGLKVKCAVNVDTVTRVPTSSIVLHILPILVGSKLISNLDIAVTLRFSVNMLDMQQNNHFINRFLRIKTTTLHM